MAIFFLSSLPGRILCPFKMSQPVSMCICAHRQRSSQWRESPLRRRCPSPRVRPAGATAFQHDARMRQACGGFHTTEPAKWRHRSARRRPCGVAWDAAPKQPRFNKAAAIIRGLICGEQSWFNQLRRACRHADADTHHASARTLSASPPPAPIPAPGRAPMH